jgi:hypothetical protein
MLQLLGFDNLTFLDSRRNPKTTTSSINAQSVLKRLPSLVPDQTQSTIVAVEVEISPRVMLIISPFSLFVIIICVVVILFKLSGNVKFN